MQTKIDANIQTFGSAIKGASFKDGNTQILGMLWKWQKNEQ